MTRTDGAALIEQCYTRSVSSVCDFCILHFLTYSVITGFLFPNNTQFFKWQTNFFLLVNLGLILNFTLSVNTTYGMYLIKPA